MIKQAEGKNKEKEELERLRNDLYLEQHEAEHRRLEEIKTRKRLEDKEEMANAYKYQMKCKEEALSKGRAEEERIKENLLRKFAEDDRLEQLSEQKRRMKVEAHKREAERLVELRRQMYEA